MKKVPHSYKDDILDTSKKSVIDLILNYSSLSADPIYFLMYAVISIHDLKHLSQSLLETRHSFDSGNCIN